MKKKIYLLSKESRSSIYGIGSYLNQLIDILKEMKISFGVIHVYADNKEVSVEKKDGYQQMSIPWINLHSPKHIHSYARNVAYLLREYFPEDKDKQIIFHVNFMMDDVLVTYLKRFFTCRVILTAHYTNWSFNLLGDYKRVQELMTLTNRQMTVQERFIKKEVKENGALIKRCDLLICVAQHSVNSFSRLNCLGKTETVVINNALKDSYTILSDLEKKQLRNKYHIDPNTNVILFAGRLDDVKGVSFLIQAFEQTLKSFPDSRLFIAGDGSFDKCISAIQNCWSKVSFTGKLEKAQLYELYSITDVGVVCSLHEEFGYVAIEMMMQAIPLIVSDTSGLAEIVENEESGLKVPVETRNEGRSVNVEILSKQINRLLNDRNWAISLGKKGRIRFLKKYELTFFKKRMLEIYNI